LSALFLQNCLFVDAATQNICMSIQYTSAVSALCPKDELITLRQEVAMPMCWPITWALHSILWCHTYMLKCRT